MTGSGRGDLQSGVGVVPPRRRLLSGALAIELVWLVLTAAVVVFLAAHLGGDADNVGGDPSTNRLLVYAVPMVTAVLALALLGARHALDRHEGSYPSVPPILRAALWVSGGGNAVLLVTIAASLYHAEASWMVLGGALLAAVGLVTAGCVRAARATRSP